MKAIITVGLGFGDEGKGATVDHLTRKLDADLVVRYCGGAQAGHNVELPDGRRHTFAQFGSGTLAGVKTYLGPRMIISPAVMVPEADHLKTLGVKQPFALLSAHPDCLVSTAYHVFMNRLRESARRTDKHGSCGLGVGETRHYWLRYGQDAVVAADLQERASLVSKLVLIRDRLLQDAQALPHIDSHWSELLHETTPETEADVLQQSAAGLRLSDRMPPSRLAIFEGAQGVLLDEWKGFHPHTTWSTVTPMHALEMAQAAGLTDVSVLGITRAFSTRHGAGPFPTWCADMSAQFVDRGNPVNDWQGSLRAGPLDLVLLNYAARVCRIDALAVTCLDQLPASPRLCEHYDRLDEIPIPHSLRDQARLTTTLESVKPVFGETSRHDILYRLNQIARVVLTADGPTHFDRTSCTPAPQLPRGLHGATMGSV